MYTQRNGVYKNLIPCLLYKNLWDKWTSKSLKLGASGIRYLMK
jgi:hypothetical protein